MAGRRKERRAGHVRRRGPKETSLERSEPIKKRSRAESCCRSCPGNFSRSSSSHASSHASSTAAGAACSRHGSRRQRTVPAAEQGEACWQFSGSLPSLSCCKPPDHAHFALFFANLSCSGQWSCPALLHKGVLTQGASAQWCAAVLCSAAVLPGSPDSLSQTAPKKVSGLLLLVRAEDRMGWGPKQGVAVFGMTQEKDLLFRTTEFRADGQAVILCVQAFAQPGIDLAKEAERVFRGHTLLKVFRAGSALCLLYPAASPGTIAISRVFLPICSGQAGWFFSVRLPWADRHRPRERRRYAIPARRPEIPQ